MTIRQSVDRATFERKIRQLPESIIDDDNARKFAVDSRDGCTTDAREFPLFINHAPPCQSNRFSRDAKATHPFMEQLAARPLLLSLTRASAAVDFPADRADHFSLACKEKGLARDVCFPRGKKRLLKRKSRISGRVASERDVRAERYFGVSLSLSQTLRDGNTARRC